MLHIQQNFCSINVVYQFEFAGFYIAKEKGFEKVGLDVEIKSMNKY